MAGWLKGALIERNGPDPRIDIFLNSGTLWGGAREIGTEIGTERASEGGCLVGVCIDLRTHLFLALFRSLWQAYPPLSPSSGFVFFSKGQDTSGKGYEMEACYLMNAKT